ncbi:MAG: transposase-like protein [Planctomycetota bacterium]|jgi:transposase-like protein
MAKRRPKVLLIRQANQVRVLSSPLRQSIVDALKRLGKGSIREIAGELGRAPATLYYHVRQLEEARLLTEIELRETARRPETVYTLVSEQIALDRSRRDEPWKKAVDRLVRTQMREMERLLIRSLRAGQEGTDDPAPLARMRMQSSRMGRKDRRELQERLADLSLFIEGAAERASKDDPVLSFLMTHAPSSDLGAKS